MKFSNLLAPIVALALVAYDGHAAVDKAALIGKMAPLTLDCIKRVEHEKYPLFHGCYDWHSAVHGHWALLRIARATKDQTGALEVERRLTSEKIAAEKALLENMPIAGDNNRERNWGRHYTYEEEQEFTDRKRPFYPFQGKVIFEMPYGRAWFLRLATEFELWANKTGTKNPQRLRDFANTIADSMIDYYHRHEPKLGYLEYDNASWALVQLHAYLMLTGDQTRLGDVNALISKLLKSPKPVMVHVDEEFTSAAGNWSRVIINAQRAGVLHELLKMYPISMMGIAAYHKPISLMSNTQTFCSVFGNWAYLVAKTQSPEALHNFLKAHPISDSDLALAKESDESLHHHSNGQIWSRAWALKALAVRGPTEAERNRLTAAYESYVAYGAREFMCERGRYREYDHWAPQFAVYALTEGLEEPITSPNTDTTSPETP